jgi:hypothetical protein
LYQVLSWALQIEQSDLNLEGLDLKKEDINKIYLQAIDWAKMLMKETEDVKRLKHKGELVGVLVKH